MEKETEYARSITKLTDHDHEALIRYYKSLKPEERTSVHDLQTEISRKNFRSDRPRTGGYSTLRSCWRSRSTCGRRADPF